MSIRKDVRIILSLLIVFMVFSSSLIVPPVTAATNEITVYVDGIKINFDVPPMIMNGRTMVPLRAIFEAMGAEVDWSQEQKLAFASDGDAMVSLYIGSLFPSVNNAVRVLDVPAVIVNSRTLAPLRFVGEAFGGTVTWNGATRTVNIYTSPSKNKEFPKNNMDFSVSPSDLSLVEDANPSRTYVRPGVKLKLTVKVHKNDVDAEGGGKVKVTLNGLQIDNLPFYIDDGKEYIAFYKDYQIPLDMPGRGPSTILKAEVVGDQLVTDTNPGNNTAQITVQVQGVERLSNDDISDSTIVSIKAKSDFGTGIAKSGGYLTLTANICGTGKKTIIGYYINGSLIEEKDITPPKSGTPTQISHTYHVPWDNTGLIRYSVKLDNGDEMFIPVTVVPFEYGVVPNSITWVKKSSAKNYISGETIALTAKIIRDNRNSFTDNFGALRVYFLINGQLSPGLKVEPPSGTAPYMGEVHYSYKVPEGQTSPLQVQVFSDPGGLLKETREDNNSTSVSIPELITGVSGNNLSVSNQSIRFAPSQAIPGEKIELFATVKNNASTIPTSSVKILLKINGETVNSATTWLSSYFNPGQTYTVYKVWEVPEDITADMTYSVEIDPDGVLTGDNKSDNKASLTVPLAKPDLSIETGSLIASPYLVSGSDGMLNARIYNTGPVNAENASVVFYINQAEVGRNTIDMPPYSTLDITSAFTVPMLPSIQNNSAMAGASGYITNQADYQNIKYMVKIDPTDTIDESNEGNNTAGPKDLKALVPSTKGTIYAKALDLDGAAITGAAMTIKAGTASVSATSDKYGYCTFSNVPFGPYEVTVTKTGYLQGRTVGEELFSGDRISYTEIFMDNRSKLTGTVTSVGQPLDGVKVENQSTFESVSSGSDGNYSLRLQSGTYAIKYTMKGYAPKTENITVGTAAELVRNVVMEQTDNIWIFGKAYDINGGIIPNLTINAIDGSQNILATTTSNAAGNYQLVVPLPQEEMWIGIRATHGGVTRTSPGYVFRGMEYPHNVSFVVEPDPVNTQSSSGAKVAPYVVCASMPGTFFNPDYKVTAIYGMFDLNLFTTIEDGHMTYLDIGTEPQYWVSATVSSSWDPGELLGLDEIPGYKIISAILPLSVPLAINMHSQNRTQVWIKKISVVSDNKEVYAVYPDAIGDYACAPNVKINWDTCRIKLYLKADPDNGVANPAAGYNLDRVLVIWNPKHKTFTKIGNYQVIGWDENTAREIYMDE